MARFLSLLIASMCILLTSACTTGKDFSDASPQLVAAPDNVSAMLADAADRASKALETLAAVEYSKTPTSSISPVSNAPIELRRAVTVNWIGPVETITKTLADRAGYNFLVIGTAPPVPVVISVDAENLPVIDVLRDVGLQLGGRGDIKVDSAQRVVEIYYPPTTGVGRQY
ncbi:MAG: DotD/TraH family lipoprotein [Alphaproteobacteria bacterium]|nr:DotD/TraH family lipoprotein [Alphaproteobacteria bacterium]